MNFYVTGGSLQFDAPSYVERKADQELIRALMEGEFCYVLTARQMGKSSLMVRTANRLRAAGVQVATLDLTAIGGQNISPDQWYHGLLDTLGQELDLEDALEDFWQAHLDLGPLHRLMKALREVVLSSLDPGNRPQPEPASLEANPHVIRRATDGSPIRLVIFVDEIDFVRSLPFSTDEFFAAIRQCYNRRPLDPIFEELTFCLLGVASPSDLVQDTRTTPFNIGRRIELNDFTAEEAGALSRGLAIAGALGPGSKAYCPESIGAHEGERAPTNESRRCDFQAQQLLERILHWTDGHPYLTQKMCRVTADGLRAGGSTAVRTDSEWRTLVDQTCKDLFFSHRARERDDNLMFVRERLLRNQADRASLLDLYRKVWLGKRIKDDELDPLITVLRLSGVVRVMDGFLQERNRIYACVFDANWVRANMPDAELQRQREAYRRGVIWAASVSSVIIFSLLLLGLVAAKKTFDGNLAEARAWRSSGQIGQRINALEAIHKANRWRFLFGDPLVLQNQAIAALNLVDLKSGPTISAAESTAPSPELSGNFSTIAMADHKGAIKFLATTNRQIQSQLVSPPFPLNWLRFGLQSQYLGAGYSTSANEQQFRLYRVGIETPVIDRIEGIPREGWDISSKGDWLALGSRFDNIRLYSLPGGALREASGPVEMQTE
jgi:hypothetical protein